METAWIIDDDEIYKYGFGKFVAMKFGWWQTISFDHGKAAIEMLADPHCATQLPDMIFLDIDMPVMNGWEFMYAFSAIKPQLKKHITIFMVSSSINYADIVRANACKDITQYIIKPVDLQQFSAAFGAAACLTA